ncbi:MAG TPA: AAA family ATPase, partial [Nostocaceae cyanobacterium]|nr:AAA family ATPase [Nostocaceae cyanobacterium]
MSKSRTSAFWNYLAECFRLLYWIYFKPYTFERWLRDIHPELKPRDNPFDKKAEFRANHRLRRYAMQVWWLISLMPIFTGLLLAPVDILVSGKSFNWFLYFSFFLGWFIAQILYIGANRSRQDIFLVALLTLFFALRFLSGLVFDLAFGVAFGVVLGVAFSVMFGVVFSVSFAVTFVPSSFSIIGSVAFGVASSMKTGVMFSVMIGLVLSAMISTTEGVKFGLAFSALWVFGALRLCCWLPELLWTIFLFLFPPNGKRVNCLRYLPPRFDELIILPLPFLGQMIVEAYQENAPVAIETIDYLITSTNQQKVAVQAIVSIAVDILNRCQRLEDIVHIANQLTWVPSPPPKEFDFVLPQLLEISQSVRASQEATTLYRRYELLNPPIRALNELKKTLAFGKNASLTTKFGSITESWLTILQLAQRTLEETAKQSQEIRQVYIAGNSLDPETAKYRFKGRIDIFREIETLTLSDQPPVLLLYGGRRTGKTSALKYLPYKVTSDIIPLLVDVQGAASATTIKGFAENLAQQIIDSARRLPR